MKWGSHRAALGRLSGMAAHPGLIVAIDGTSGSGKSSTSRGIAARFGLRYLDTGAMYRAAAWWMLRNSVDIAVASAIASAAESFEIHSTTDPNAPAISVDGTDVSEAIREADVTGAVSAVSAVPAIRERLVQLQRGAVRDACALSNGIVVEGRDIGTVVLPDADIKIYLVADPAARAARRAEQDELEGRAADVANVEEALRARDRADSSRDASPLTKAPDAFEVDATFMNLAQVIDSISDLIVEQVPSAALLVGARDD